MFDALFEHIQQFTEFTVANEHQLAPCLRLQQLRKGQKILVQGRVCVFMVFVVQGLLRVYHTDEHDADYTMYFATENSWSTDLLSFQHKQPSVLHIESMEDAEIITIDYQSWHYIQNEIPALRAYSQEILRQMLMREQARTLSLLRDSALQRYQQFLRAYPNLARRISQKHVVSYLGFSPEFLSKIRRKLPASEPPLQEGLS